MADNYLEKKYESLRQGRPVYRKTSPSLDSLLRSCAESVGQEPSSYKVKMAQLQAIVRSASELGVAACCECRESDAGPGFISVAFSGSSTVDILEAGEYILAMRLKAAELGLKCHITDMKEMEKTPSELRIEVFISR